MSNAHVDIFAPRELILPNRRINAGQGLGSLFVSGGYLCMMSGSTMLRFSGAVLNPDEA